jgi:spore germination protein YaaH
MMVRKNKTRGLLYLLLQLAYASLILINPPRANGEGHQAENISGWIVYWDIDSGIETLKKHSQGFNEINLFNYAFDEDGRIIENLPSFNERIESLKPSTLKKHKIIPTLVNDVMGAGAKDRILKGPEIIHSILSDNQRRGRLINEILDLIADRSYDGIDIDFEKLYFKDRELFTGFIKELADAIHSKNKILALTAQQKSADNSQDGAGAIDWEAISAYADKVRIMCYNFSSPSSEAGAIAPAAWIDKIIAFAKTRIPADKIVIILALHGYDWSKEGVKSLTYEQAMRLARRHKAKIRWNSSAGAPYFTYLNNGLPHKVWFENKKSIYHKLKVIKKHAVKSIAFWRLGGEDRRIYSLF